MYASRLITTRFRKSLTTVDSECVTIVSFEGGGDDMDWPIKDALLTSNAGSKRSFCGVNSYNIGRPLVQMVHWVSSTDSNRKKID